MSLNVDGERKVPTMKLTFKKNGTVKKETFDFEGKSCVDLTAFIEEGLHAHGDSGKVFKDEYHNRRLDAGNQVSA